MERQCPRDVPPVIRLPMFGKRLLNNLTKLKWIRYMPPSGQLIWDLKCGLITDRMSVSLIHSPRPPAQGTIKVGIDNARYARLMSEPVQSQQALSTCDARHDLVLVTPYPGSIMEPSQGYDPRIPSSAQTPHYGHISGKSGRTHMQPGPDVSSGEWTSVPRPKTKLPDDMTGSNQGQRVAMGSFGLAHPNYNSSTQHNHTPCVVWVCGHGLMDSRSYEE